MHIILNRKITEKNVTIDILYNNRVYLSQSKRNKRVDLTNHQRKRAQEKSLRLSAGDNKQPAIKEVFLLFYFWL